MKKSIYSSIYSSIYLVVEEFFYVLSFGSLLLAILELINPRMILTWLNLNLWLALWLASGIMMLVIKYGQQKAK